MVCALNGQFGAIIGQACVLDCKTRRHNGNIMDQPQAPMPPERNNLTIPDTQRTAIMQFLLKRTHPDTGQLMRGAKKAAASHFDVHRNTIYNIWERAKENLDENGRGAARTRLLRL
jgi:hypothetical protein